MTLEQSDLALRAAQPDEAAIIVNQRRAMFAEIRQMAGPQLDALDAAFRP